MQSAKYPNLDNFQQQQQIGNPLVQSQQLGECQVQINPYKNTSSVNNQQVEQYQQYSEYLSNQVMPQIDSHQAQLLISQQSTRLKDQDFSQQKLFICGILGLFILWNFLFYFIIYFILLVLRNYGIYKFNNIFPIFLVISITSMILLSRFAIKNNINKNFVYVIYYLGILLSYIMVYLFLILSLYWDGFNKMNFVLPILWCSIVAMMSNFIFNFVVLVYVLIEQKQFRIHFVIDAILIEIVIIFYFAFFYQDIVFIISIPLCLIYPVCLMISLKQILRGRFNLESNQVIKGSIATFYGLIVCCPIEE